MIRLKDTRTKMLAYVALLMTLVVAGCGTPATPDVAATVEAAVAATVAAQAAVAEAVAATLTGAPPDSAEGMPAQDPSPSASAGTKADPTNTLSPSDTPPPTDTPRPTATPRPTDTPGSTTVPTPEGLGSRGNPYSVGEVAPMVMDGNLEFTLAVVEVLRGDPAWQKILNANQFNDPAPDGFEWVVVRVEVSYTGQDEGLLEISERDFAVVTKGRVLTSSDTWTYSPCCIEPELDVSLFAGGTADGWIAVPVATDDPSPLLAVGIDAGGIFFSLTP